jgi:predicted RNA-binding protein
MAQDAGMRGEKIYECDLALTGVTDYGVTMEDILTGKQAVPLQGARLDLHVDGPCRGRLSGRQHGVDYLRMRADGRIDLDLHVVVETDDGHRIALSGDGQAAPRKGEPVFDIFANIRLTTASREYEWVNARQIWSVGTGDLATGRIRVTAYMQ